MPKQTSGSDSSVDTVETEDGVKPASIEDRLQALEEAVFVHLADVLNYHRPRVATPAGAVEPTD